MKDKRLLVILCLIISLLITALTVFATEEVFPTLSAKAAALYEPINNRFIFQKNAHLRLPMASTTKIMTALLAIERCDENELIKIPQEAVGIEGTSVYLKEGDEVYIRDLIYSVLLQSANDASVALAITVGGDVSGFVDMMNKKADEIELLDTHFENPHGLYSENHYTTASDLSLLASYALKNPRFKEITSTYKYSFSLGDSERTVVNHNKMLKKYDGCIGVKTGYTKKSGRCLVSAAERDGLTFVAVTLNAPDDWSDHTKMLDYGYNRFEAIKISSITNTHFELPIIGSDKKTALLSVRADDDLMLVKRKNGNYFTAEIILPKYLVAPVMQGDKVGELLIKQNGQTVRIIDIAADQTSQNIEKKNKFLWF